MGFVAKECTKMLLTQAFVLRALSLASKGEPIPMSEANFRFLPALIWSGHLTDVSKEDHEPVLRATLTPEGREYLHRLQG